MPLHLTLTNTSKRLDCDSDVFQPKCGLGYSDAYHHSALHSGDCFNGTGAHQGEWTHTLKTRTLTRPLTLESRHKYLLPTISPPPPSVLFAFCFPCGRCTDCTAAGAAAWSVLSRSGAPACGRAHLWGKQASTPLLRQPKARACPSTPLQCRATPTTVAGDSTAPPLDGDRYSHTAGHFCDAREMTWKCHIISTWHDKHAFEWEDRIAMKYFISKLLYRPQTSSVLKRDICLNIPFLFMCVYILFLEVNERDLEFYAMKDICLGRWPVSQICNWKAQKKSVNSLLTAGHVPYGHLW